MSYLERMLGANAPKPDPNVEYRGVGSITANEEGTGTIKPFADNNEIKEGFKKVVPTTTVDTSNTAQVVTTPTLTPQQQYDQDYLNGMDEESRKRTQGIINAEGLQAQIDAAKWAEETPEQQAARLKKERNERNMVGAIGLLGALGNMAVAAGHPSGRSMPANNVSEAVDKRQTAAQQQRELALAKLNKARGRKSQLIEQGYSDTDKRKQLAEQREYQKKQLEMQQKQLDRQIANDAVTNYYKDQDAERKDKELKMKEEYNKAMLGIKRAKNNGNGSNGSKDKHTNFFVNGANGMETIPIPSESYKGIVAYAYETALKNDADKEKLNAIFEDLAQDILNSEETTDEQKEEANEFITLDKNKKQKWIPKNNDNMFAALQRLVAAGGGTDAVKAIRAAVNGNDASSDGKSGKKQSPTGGKTIKKSPTA